MRLGHNALRESEDNMSSTTMERSVQVEGAQLRYREAGQGSPVVILRSAGGHPESPFQALLAEQFRVISMEVPALTTGEQRKSAHTLNQAATVIGLDHYVLISAADSAPVALWQAVDAPDHIDGLVLFSPRVLLPEGHAEVNGATRDPELEGRLADVQVATLILFGTNDTALPPETGRMYVERMPDCYFALVYDAGRDIETERPQALSEAVCDFIERRGMFIVERNSTAINP